MTYFQKIRQGFIDAVIQDEGCINRTDIMDKFEISVAQASLDLKTWQKNNPGVIKYNTSKRRYELKP